MASPGYATGNFSSDAAYPDYNFTDDLEYDLDKLYQEFKQSLYRTEDPIVLTLVAAYIVGFVLALLGNLMVLAVILGNKSMRTSNTNSYLLNLAVADLLVSLVCIPLTVGETIYKGWVYGYLLCKTTNYLQGLCISASVLTITALSLDRYMLIQHPVRVRRTGPGAPRVRLTIVAIWSISAIIMVPLAIVPSVTLHSLGSNDTVAMCGEHWAPTMSRTAFDVFLFVFIYMVPGAVVLFSYSSTGCRLMTTDSLLQRSNSDLNSGTKLQAGRRRLARMLLVLASLFAVSWMPYHAVNLYMDFTNDSKSKTLLYLLSFALFLGHSHSAQNPILYYVMSRKFREGVLDMVKCRQNSIVRVESYPLKSKGDSRSPCKCVVSANHRMHEEGHL